MDDRHQRLVELTRNLDSNEVSRATSPGGPQSTELPTRTRTFPYDELLPYKVEDNQSRQDFLHTIIENLYVAVRSHDYQLNAARWTRELKAWLSLKFTMSKQERVVLAQLYFELVLASGVESSASDRFTSMLSLLLKRKSYLVPIEDLILDWRPLLERFKLQVVERRSSTSWSASYQPSLSSLKNIAPFVQPYFDPDEAMDMLSEILQYFNTSNIEEAYTSMQLLNLLFPTAASQTVNENGSYQRYLPTFFHLWGLLGRSKLLDTTFMDLLSRMARDALTNQEAPFSQHGIFTLSQSKAIFTAVLRLLELPVGQSSSSYPATSSSQDSFGLLLEKDTKKFPSVYHVARLIVMSLSPSCLEHENSTLYDLEGLLQAIENFFHPSNAGSWSHRLPRFVYFLADFFTMRWSREKSGEMNVTADRRLTPDLKRRFVLCLKEPVMLGLYSKSETAQSYALSALKNLAYLEPDEILPAALQRIYPSIQGLVEVHRTLPSLRALQTVTGEIVRHKGYRCHLTTLLGFILPGIDPNDLVKTTFTLHVLQGVCYQVPLHDISKGGEDLGSSAIAMDWITSELEQMELQGPNWQPNYSEKLSEQQADLIARSSTAGLTEFVSAFLGKIFTLLENLPDPAKSKKRLNPEENVVNILPAVFTPLMAALSPELYDMVLERVCKFVSDHVIHQARDAMAFILNSICRVNPEKALKSIVPMFVAMIHVEIDENGAGSSRQTGTDVLPRDRGLVWAISLLSMSIVHTGAAVLAFETEIVETIDFLQQRCRGTVGIHISNLIHHLLINLTGTYTSDYRIFEDCVSNASLGPNDWGRLTPADELTIHWHVPTKPELELAIRLFQDQTKKACDTLSQLVNNTNVIKRGDGTKAWSDEVSRNLVLLRLTVSGAATLFVKDEDATGTQASSLTHDTRMDTENGEDYDEDVDGYDEALFSMDCARGNTAEDANLLSKDLKGARKLIAFTIHQVHACLVQEEPDDTSSFTSLYSAYKALLVDVGFEKTAKVLDRVTRVYASDIAPYKMSGVRKHYPRSILLRRAYVYHLQRMRENVKLRDATAEEYQMMHDLAESSVSVYTTVRKSAQSALDAIFKVMTKGRVQLLPTIVKSLQEGVATSDYGKIKGPLYMLLYGSLSSRLSRDWRYIPIVTHGFLQAYEVDRLSVQKLCSGGTNSLINMMWSEDAPVEVQINVLSALKASTPEIEDRIKHRISQIEQRAQFNKTKRTELEKELLRIVKSSHWKQAMRTVTVLTAIGIGFEKLSSPDVVKLIAEGAIDQHPSLRAIYAGGLLGLLSVLALRSASQHDRLKFLNGEYKFMGVTKIGVSDKQARQTQDFLNNFKSGGADWYIDDHHSGWLFWPKQIEIFQPDKVHASDKYDEVEMRVISAFKACMTKTWFNGLFDILAQEPREGGADRFRLHSTLLLQAIFDLLLDGHTEATLADIGELITTRFVVTADKHTHRAISELLAGLMVAANEKSSETMHQVEQLCIPIALEALGRGFSTETIEYWTSFLTYVYRDNDPRRWWPITQWIANYRLDMGSNAATVESAKMKLVNAYIINTGWHFQMEEPLLRDFFQNLDHPYKGVRDSMGSAIATIFQTRHYEGYQNLEALIAAQREKGGLGVPPYGNRGMFDDVLTGTLERIENWRQERVPGQQSASSYTSGSKTFLTWLTLTVTNFDAGKLCPHAASLIIPLLHMMDVKEDKELQVLAYQLYREIASIPFRQGQQDELIQTLISTGLTSTLWHQRLRILVNVQTLFFRQLFVLSSQQQSQLFTCVASMLKDTQLEVRLGAMATLSGMIQCSRKEMRIKMVQGLKRTFTKTLIDNPLPKRMRAKSRADQKGEEKEADEGKTSELVIKRHSAVLGLGSLVQAFPYLSPPPSWIAEVLATLANRANSDPGIVGQSVKTILSDFKKTRQDTWQTDLKAFTSEQQEDLEGVLWKSYFA